MKFHIPTYKYCGPGTSSQTDIPINQIDEICKRHDDAYGRGVDTLLADAEMLTELDETSKLTCFEWFTKQICVVGIKSKMLFTRFIRGLRHGCE